LASNMAEVPDYNYGIDAELKRKQDAKTDLGEYNRAVAFVKAHVPEASELTPLNFHDIMKDGQMLCALGNALWPGSCTGVSKSKMPFNQMENIAKYLNACTAAGMVSTDLFQTVDLFEAKNINQVIHNLKICQKLATGDMKPKVVAPAAVGNTPMFPGGPPGARDGAVQTIDRSRGIGGKVTQGVANDDVTYGMDRELKAKMEEKYTPEMRAKGKAIVERILGITLESDDLQEELKSGVVLCKMMLAVNPGSIPAPKTSKMPFIQMENIASYLNGCQAMGLAVPDQFQTVDLFEGKNMGAVVQNLEAFARKCGK